MAGKKAASMSGAIVNVILFIRFAIIFSIKNSVSFAAVRIRFRVLPSESLTAVVSANVTPAGENHPWMKCRFDEPYSRKLFAWPTFYLLWR
jgi:hypothetical protein